MTKSLSNEIKGDILVVDDNLPSLRALSSLLMEHGYHVRSARDGATALMMASADPPDLVLLDVIMPEMDGFQVCRRLKTDPETGEVPVIFVSALDEVVDNVRGFEVGGVDYITKPFQAEEVLARVKTHLTLHDLRKELERRNEELQQEIAERIQAEEEASFERDLMQALLDNTPDYVYFKDRDRRFVRASNAFRNLFKRSLDDIIGKTDEELFPEEIAQETVSDDRRVIETGKPLINREEGGSIAGEDHWVLTTKLPWYDKDGNIIGLFGISREITERRRAEQALRESEEQFRNLAEQSPNMIFINQRGKVVYANEMCEDVIGYAREEFYSPDFDLNTIIAPEYLDLIETNFRKHMSGEDVPPYEYALITKEGKSVQAIITTKLIRYGGEDAILGIVTDITARVQAEEALRERVVELSTLHSIAGMVATITDLPQALQAVAEIMTSLFNTRVTLITVPDAEGGELQILAGFERGSGGFASTAQAFPLNEMPITRGVLEQGQTMVLPDVQALPLAAPMRAYVSDLGLHAFMLVPLKARGTVIGILALGADQTDQALTPVDVALAETIAVDVAVAIENARLVEQARAAAVDTERSRLARELHDSVTQALYSITLHTDATLLALSAGKTDVVEDRLKRLNQHAREAMTEMRLLIHELRPSILEESGLAESLRARLESVETRSGLKADLHVINEQRLPPEVEDALYRVALEGLNNVLKHARASKVELGLSFDEDAVRLTIQDDGTGFDLDSATHYGGYGLAMMKERVQHIGGELSIETAPGAGTKLRVEVKA